MKIKANAKINLFLDIVGKREDGYHNIETIFQEIDLSDTIEIDFSNNGFTLRCNIQELEGDDNLLKKAYTEIEDFLPEISGLDIYLEKNIPFGAGLGGGSSDCAAFMNALKDLTDSKISNNKMLSIGSKLGADVPFFFYGGTCIGKGIGDKLEKINHNNKLNILIVNPGIHVSTKEAYQGCIIKGGKQSLNEIVKGFETGDIERIAAHLYNSFEQSVFKTHPDIKACKEKIKKLGAMGSIMSGSGSTCFGIFEDMNRAVQARDFFIEQKSYFAKAVETIIR